MTSQESEVWFRGSLLQYPQLVRLDGDRQVWHSLVLAQNLFLQNQFVTGFVSGSQCFHNLTGTIPT